MIHTLGIEDPTSEGQGSPNPHSASSGPGTDVAPWFTTRSLGPCPSWSPYVGAGLEVRSAPVRDPCLCLLLGGPHTPEPH